MCMFQRGKSVLSAGCVAVLVLYGIFGLVGVARAQSTALLTGTVVDPSGAVVGEAQVVCRNEATGVSRSTTTNIQGLFRLPDLPIGTYELTVSHEGFENLVQGGIQLLTGHSVDLRLSLRLGQTTESVQVTAAAALVQPTSSEMQASIDGRNMRDLPLNGRNPLQLITLTPGAVMSTVGTQGNQQENPGIVTNGLRAIDNNYQIDGVTYVNRNHDSAPILPNPDALQEFTVKSSDYSASEPGAGATVLLATRSGTNDFHGSAFEFLRNDKLDARNFFASTVTPFKRNQYGGTFGGPVIKDKSFFFLAYQGTRVRGGATPALVTVPAVPWRDGDFATSTKIIVDPLTQQPFPGNRIPASRMNALSQKLLPLVPLPNLPNNRASQKPDVNQNDDQFVARFDYNISSRDHFTARYFFDEFDYQRNTSAVAGIYAQNDFRGQNLLVSETHTFSPTLLLTASFGYSRDARTQVPQTPFTAQSLGQKVPDGITGAPPELRVNINGYVNLFTGGGLAFRPQFWDYRVRFTWAKGKHMVQFGMEAEQDQMYSEDTSFSSGTTTFNGSRTALATVARSGDQFADFLLGLPNGFTQGGRTPQDFPQVRWQPWIQDDWKVLPRLTLNLGIRWEPWLPAIDRLGPATGFVPGVQSVVAPDAPTGLLFSGDPGLRASIIPADWNNFAPRVGFAWDALGDGKMVVRSSYGIFYRSLPLNLFRTANSGSAFRSLSTNIPNPPSFEDPYADFPGGPPFPFVPPKTSDLATYQFVRPVVTIALDPGIRSGYTQEWNFTLERQFRHDLAVSAAYVGNHSIGIIGAHTANPAVYRPGATVGNTDSRRLYEGLGALGVNSAWMFSNYSGLQINLTKRSAAGLSLLANYVYSKCLDNESGKVQGGDAGANGGINPFNLNAYYGPCDFDYRHRGNISAIYSIPRAGALPAFADKIVNGWEVTGIISAASGAPFTVKSGRDNSLSGTNNDNADQIAPLGNPGSDQLARYFDTSAFTVNALGTFGTSGRNRLRGLASWNLDFGAFKRIPITEQLAAEFRFEAFNFFNHSQFGTPVASVTNANFGKILSADSPRVIQFAMKVIF
jgi:hypothetical protein